MRKRVKILILFLIIVQLFFCARILANNSNNNVEYTLEEQAIREVADAYYRKGKNVQYCGWRLTQINPPEEATSQNNNYSVCTNFTYQVYAQALGFKGGYPNSNRLIAYGRKYYDVNNTQTNDVIEYWERKSDGSFVDNSGNVREIDLSTTDARIEYGNYLLNEVKIQVGDIICYHKGGSGSGHGVLVYEIVYDSDGNPTDAIIRESTSNYDTKTTKISKGLCYHDVLNSQTGIYEGTYRSYSLLHQYKLDDDTTKHSLAYSFRNSNYFTIIRPLLKDNNGNYTGKYYLPEYRYKSSEPTKYECIDRHLENYQITDSASKRIKYSSIDIEKTVDVFNNSTIQLGDKLEYTIKVTNYSDSQYKSFDIIENIPEYVEVENSANGTVNGNKIKWTISKLDAKDSVEIKYSTKVRLDASYIGKEIVSTGTVAGIPSATVTNFIGGNLSSEQQSKLLSAINALADSGEIINHRGSNLIKTAYKSAFGIDIDIDSLDITNLVAINDSEEEKNYDINSYRDEEGDSLYNNPSVYLNNDNPFAKMLLPNYYGALKTRNNGNVYLRYWENLASKTISRSERADNIYQENFQVGDILVYKNTQTPNSNVTYTAEDGMYYLIYVGDKDTIRYVDTYTNYSGFLGIDSNGHTQNIALNYTDLRTILGKDYYAILRPSMVVDVLPMELSTTYSITEKTSENVQVEIHSNEEMLPVSGWSLSDDKKTLSKEYTQNGGEQIKVYDYSGNEKSVDVSVSNIEKNMTVQYSANVESSGWQSWKSNGETAGTSGQALRLEGLKIKLIDAPEGAELQYNGHVQDIGWQDWKTDGQVTGTEGQSKRIEAIRIKIKNQDKYSIKYRVHVENIGWQDWKRDGEVAGTTGQALRIEAIEIMVEEKTPEGIIRSNGSISDVYYANTSLSDEGVYYTNLEQSRLRVYIDGVDYTNNLTTSEIKTNIDQINNGNGFNIYNFKLNIKSINEIADGKKTIHYVLVDKDGNEIATHDRTIAINKSNLQVLYEAHVENIGWQSKVFKNGEMAGTEGRALRVEAFKIYLKNAPQGAGITYQSHVENIGWQNWKNDGDLTGTTGQALRVEAIRIKLRNLDDYTVKYRVHIENIGWQEWKQDGEIAGTSGQALRLEAIEIKLEPKNASGKINLDNTASKIYYMNDSIIETGSYYVNMDNASLKVSLNDVDYSQNIVFSKIDSFDKEFKVGNGFNAYNFTFNKDVNSIENGEYTIKYCIQDTKGNTINTISKKIIVDKSTPHVFYKIYESNKGWTTGLKKDGETAGGSAIQGINIYTKNLPTGVSISYQTHVANIGWMNWTQEEKNAGSPGSNNAIEAIRIKLNNDDNYTIKYRAYVEGNGWQEWKYDGALAGSTGLGKAITSIEIVLTSKEIRATSGFNQDNKAIFDEDTDLTGFYLTNIPNTSLDLLIDNKSVNNLITQSQDNTIYEKYEGYGDSSNTALPIYSVRLDKNYIETIGNGGHILKLSIKDGEKIIYTRTYTFVVDLNNLHIKYSINGSNYYKDGEAGDTSQAIKNVKAYLVNNNDNIDLQYMAYFSNSGWENTWHNANEVAYNNNKTIQAIRFKINSDQYSIQYKLKVDNSWEQDYSYDGEYAGAVGQTKSVTGIMVRIAPKITVDMAKMNVDFPKEKIKRGAYTFTGWGVCNNPSAILKVYLDGDSVSATRTNREDVLNTVKGYKGDISTPKPGFEAIVDLSKAKFGKHTLKLQYITSNGLIIKTMEHQFEVVNQITVETGVYGSSGLKVKGQDGYNLEYYRFGDGPNVAFFTFEVHGFEDHWDRDGTELVVTAIKFFQRLQADNDYEIGDKWTIYIFPECNPDGRNKGYTNDGPGRTTLYSIYGDVGIDMNRCWSTDFEPRYNARNYTGQFSFAAYEAQDLKEFLLAHKSTEGQTILVDCHGWLSQLIGDTEMMSYYNAQFPGSKLTYTYGKGYLINWARANLGANGKTAKSILVELPNTVHCGEDFVDQNIANRFIDASINMLKGIK